MPVIIEEPSGLSEKSKMAVLPGLPSPRNPSAAKIIEASFEDISPTERRNLNSRLTNA